MAILSARRCNNIGKIASFQKGEVLQFAKILAFRDFHSLSLNSTGNVTKLQVIGFCSSRVNVDNNNKFLQLLVALPVHNFNVYWEIAILCQFLAINAIVLIAAREAVGKTFKFS